MDKSILKVLLVFLLLFGFAVNSPASAEDMDRPYGKGEQTRPPTKEKMEEVRKRIETLRMWKLTKALDLDERTSSMIFPIMNKYDKARAEIEMSVRNDMKELRESLKEHREGHLRQILDKLEQGHRELQKIKDDEWTELKRVLTVEQQAKFVLFLQEFEREIRNIIMDVKERRAAGTGKEGHEKPLPR